MVNVAIDGMCDSRLRPVRDAFAEHRAGPDRAPRALRLIDALYASL